MAVSGPSAVAGLPDFREPFLLSGNRLGPAGQGRAGPHCGGGQARRTGQAGLTLRTAISSNVERHPEVLAQAPDARVREEADKARPDPECARRAGHWDVAAGLSDGRGGPIIGRLVARCGERAPPAL